MSENLFKCPVCESEQAQAMNRLKDGKRICTSYIMDIYNPLYNERVIVQACSQCGALKATKLNIMDSDSDPKLKATTAVLLGTDQPAIKKESIE